MCDDERVARVNLNPKTWLKPQQTPPMSGAVSGAVELLAVPQDGADKSWIEDVILSSIRDCSELTCKLLTPKGAPASIEAFLVLLERMPLPDIADILELIAGQMRLQRLAIRPFGGQRNLFDRW